MENTVDNLGKMRELNRIPAYSMYLSTKLSTGKIDLFQSFNYTSQWNTATHYILTTTFIIYIIRIAWVIIWNLK